MQTHSQVQRSVHTVSRLSKYSLFIFQCAMHTNYVFVIISFVFFHRSISPLVLSVASTEEYLFTQLLYR